MAKIYVILPVHNRREITQIFVECLRAQTCSDYHLVLVDDGSTDGTEQMARQRLPQGSLTVLRGRGDWWWGGSLQRGIDWLAASSIQDDALVLFINDDVRFPPDFLEHAVAVMASRRGSLVLARFRAPNGEIAETGVAADLRHLSFTVAEQGAQINCLSTRGLFAHWETVRAIGGFHPRLLPHYLSDYEYTIRACRKGIRCETSPALVIEPDVGATGYHSIPDKRFTSFVKKYFSKKSPANPLYLSSFVVLTSEPLWLIPTLGRVWVRAGKTLLRALVNS